MPKKQPKVVASSSEDNENFEMEEDYDSEGDSEGLQDTNPATIREVNKDNVLNYQTDSEDDSEGLDSGNDELE